MSIYVYIYITPLNAKKINDNKDNNHNPKYTRKLVNSIILMQMLANVYTFSQRSSNTKG